MFFFFSSRRRHTRYWRDWSSDVCSSDLLRADPRLRIIQTLTRSHPAGWDGYTRRIDPAMLEEALGRPDPESLAYVCGPTQLVENVASDLVALGYSPERVKTERYGPVGG